MKLGIVSDTHFGFKWGDERGEDAFRNAREAFERVQDCDLVLLPGDIFDNKVPRQEVLDRAAEVFNVFKQGRCDIKVAEDSPVDATFDGTPVVAIHGTHERRTEGYTNPIQLLETMGYLTHLHNETLVVEKEGERVAVAGMSGVPERYAPGVLERFDPQPVDDAYNLFMFHQSVEGFVYTDPDQDVLSLPQLPTGFDLLVDGHIHWRDLDAGDAERPLIFPGSTVATQMRKIEAETPKGVVTVDTVTGDVAFHALASPRALYYEEITVDDTDTAGVLEVVDARIDAIRDDDHDRTPLVRLVVTGDATADVTARQLEDRYDDLLVSATVRLHDSDGEAGLTDRAAVAAEARDILRDQLSVEVPRLDDLYTTLEEGRVDDALALVEELELPEDDEEGDDDDDAAPSDEGTTLAAYTD